MRTKQVNTLPRGEDLRRADMFLLGTIATVKNFPSSRRPNVMGLRPQTLPLRRAPFSALLSLMAVSRPILTTRVRSLAVVFEKDETLLVASPINLSTDLAKRVNNSTHAPPLPPPIFQDETLLIPWLFFCAETPAVVGHLPAGRVERFPSGAGLTAPEPDT